MQIIVADLACLPGHLQAATPHPLDFLAAGFLLVFVGLVLPAVWSRKSFRRQAAAGVLKIALEFTQVILKFLKK